MPKPLESGIAGRRPLALSPTDGVPIPFGMLQSAGCGLTSSAWMCLEDHPFMFGAHEVGSIG
jgi:hypothetical protein